MSEQTIRRTLTDAPAAGSEAQTLLGALEHARRSFAWKYAGLDAADLARTLGVSRVSLGGMLQHLARLEDDTFGWKLFGWARTGRVQDRQRDWQFSATDDAELAWRRWCGAVEQSRRAVELALQDGGLDRAEGAYVPGSGTPSLRRLITDMIESYARYTGQADLIRESIDGRMGQDVPAEVA